MSNSDQFNDDAKKVVDRHADARAETLRPLIYSITDKLDDLTKGAFGSPTEMEQLFDLVVEFMYSTRRIRDQWVTTLETEIDWSRGSEFNPWVSKGIAIQAQINANFVKIGDVIFVNLKEQGQSLSEEPAKSLVVTIIKQMRSLVL